MTRDFDAATPEEEIAAWVSKGAPAEALLALLPEQHPLYAGRSANETMRIRSFILAAFERAGLPQDALPFVCEELESGRDAYLVAGAAKALRGGAADARFAPLLRKALGNIEYLDSPITFDSYKPRWPIANPTNAAAEIHKTLSWLGASAEGDDCCDIKFGLDRTHRSVDPDLELEDQDGRTLRFGEYVRGKPTVVAFFYSRCDNPNKCSLTITKLAQLQRELGGNVRIAAFTYDPLYDLPPRMKLFGQNRGFQFHDDARFFRTRGDFESLRAAFDLGVNFIGSTPNRHRIELYVLDARGRVVATFSRMQWDVAAVLAELSKTRVLRDAVLSAIAPLVIALLPKCPLCLGAYLAAFGVSGLQIAPHRPWILALSLVFVIVNLSMIFRRSRRTANLVPFALAVVGATVLIAGAAFGAPLALTGAAILVAASVVSSMNVRLARRRPAAVYAKSS
jgi:protein SCO1/2